MIIREEFDEKIYILPLKSMEKIFLNDFNYLKTFIQFCSQTYKQDSLNNIYIRTIQSIDNMQSYPYPLLIVNKKDLIFIKDVLESMISKKITKNFGPIKKKRAIISGINFLNSIIKG